MTPLSLLNERQMMAGMAEADSNIYFVRSGSNGPIKIGVARNVLRRLRSLQTANDRPLYYLTAYQITASLAFAKEHLVQRTFKLSRIKGEWFFPSPILLRFIIGLSFGADIGWALDDAKALLESAEMP